MALKNLLIMALKIYILKQFEMKLLQPDALIALTPYKLWYFTKEPHLFIFIQIIFCKSSLTKEACEITPPLKNQQTFSVCPFLTLNIQIRMNAIEDCSEWCARWASVSSQSQADARAARSTVDSARSIFNLTTRSLRYQILNYEVYRCIQICVCLWMVNFRRLFFLYLFFVASYDSQARLITSSVTCFYAYSLPVKSNYDL